MAGGRVLSQWHLSHFWIAERDGEAAAALCALPVGEARTTVRPAIEEAARATGLSESDLAAMGQRSAYARLCWSWADDNDWMIEHVATRPAHRGQGLVPALLEHAIRTGRESGFKHASIGFYIGNDVAERCYAKAGFCFAEERRHPDFEALTGAPGFRRFARDL
ncbi:MAG: GNAT family N-acetyltransferase [Xanthobacteraceae bacterium]|nr:GNAT family N-acetyltransferase [Xanthobacteraceae bacterium]